MFCFRAVGLFLLFGITLGSYAPYYDLADAEQHFADFINKYEKKYESAEEFRQRFDIFKRNLNKLNEWNAQYKHEKGGYVITQFSDQDGLRSCVDLSHMSNTTRKHQVKKEYILNAPDKIDYRNQGLVTEVKNQGQHCGSCFIFSAIGNIEGVSAKQTRQLVSLSEQQVLDCTNAACTGGGWPVNVMNDMANSPGIMAEGDYPYTAQKGTCSADPNNVKVKVTGGHEIQTPDVETMKGALDENGAPLSVSFFASKSLMNYIGTDVLNPADCNNNQPNHAVLLVGYDADSSSGIRPHWIIKNSWGTGHGDQGYHYLDFENNCAFGQQGTASSSV